MPEQGLVPRNTSVQKYEEFYVFLCAQVLQEISRTIMIRKVTNDSTPPKVEDELRNAIQTTIQRFHLYDQEQPIHYGCLCKHGIDHMPSQDDLDIMIEYYLPFDLQDSEKITLLKVSYIEKKIPSILTKNESWLATLDSLPLFRDNYDMPFTVAKILSELDQKIHMKPIHFYQKWSNTKVPFGVFLFQITKPEASCKSLRDMNLLVKDLVPMMWGDLMEPAIELFMKDPEQMRLGGM